ncbi:GNAT family N-acetyltransferase [Candidatus Peregrinibacteria bacterium]|nr:GNAT family N-acetyltransferase [Candidatus Peregrinibacteria bacterium]
MNTRKGIIADFKKLEWGWEEEWVKKIQSKYKKGIKEGSQEFLVLETDENIVGEIHIFWKKQDTDEADGKKRAYLCAFRIHPDFQGQGLGRALFQRAEKRVQEKSFTEITIGAYKHEPELQDLYKRWGFTEFVKENIEESTEGKPIYILLLKKIVI